MEIIYEDNHILAVNKAVGEIVQKDMTGDDSLIETLKAFLIRRDKRPGDVFLVPVHRLDRPTSGVVVFARTSKALTRLSKIFQDRKIDKKYWAVCENKPDPPKGRLEDWLRKNETKNKSFVVDSSAKNAKKAILDYKIVGASDQYAMIEIMLHSGRHHQIRVQLSNIGCAIRGDLKYGYPKSNRNSGIHLHARSISFIHPVKKERITIVAPVPAVDQLWVFFDNLMEYDAGY